MRIAFFLAEAKDVVSVCDGNGHRDARVAAVQSVLVAGLAVRCGIYCCSLEEVL